MKRSHIFLALGVLIAGLALAAGPTIQDAGWAFKGGLSIGSGSTWDTASNRITKRLGKTATIDFASTSRGAVFSSAITVTGAAVGDICTVSAPAAASALKAKFSCVVTATDEAKVIFEPLDFTTGQVALTSGTPSTATATVTASSVCTCTPVGATAAIAAAGCATGVSSTTLTLTGPNTVTTTMTYDCAAPVNPASGDYALELVRNGS